MNDMQTQCPHGERVRREGTSAKGPWVGWFCPLKKNDPNQCKPEFESKRDKATPTQKFNAELGAAVQAQRQDNKDALITRTAVVKSLIERGDHFNVASVKEAQQWVNWIEGKS